MYPRGDVLSWAACRLLDDLGLPQLAPTLIKVDNTGAIELSKDRKSCNRSRHIHRRYFKVREQVAAGAVRVEHVPTADNSADMLTKWLPRDVFMRHCSDMMSGPGVAESCVQSGSGVAEGGVDG